MSATPKFTTLICRSADCCCPCCFDVAKARGPAPADLASMRPSLPTGTTDTVPRAFHPAPLELAPPKEETAGPHQLRKWHGQFDSPAALSTRDPRGLYANGSFVKLSTGSSLPTDHAASRYHSDKWRLSRIRTRSHHWDSPGTHRRVPGLLLARSIYSG